MFVSNPNKESVRDRVADGMGLGLVFAAIYSLLAALLYLVRGGHAFAALGLSLWKAILLYAVGGILTGGITGLLKPFARTLVGAIFIGIAAALPASFIIMSVVGSEGPIRVIVLAAITFAVIFGTFGGYQFWSSSRDKASTKSEPQ